jgi:hypothetical protein
LDGRLRAALAPPPDRVERIVRRALAGERAPRRLRRLVPASLLGALLVLAVVLSVRNSGPRPPARPAVASIESVGTVVIATAGEERRPLILSGPRETGRSEIILVRHGDPE